MPTHLQIAKAMEITSDFKDRMIVLANALPENAAC